MGNECSQACTNSKSKKPTRSRENTLNALNTSNNVNWSDEETRREFSVKYLSQVLNSANLGNSKVVKSYIEQGFLIDYPLDQFGWTLLHLACQNADSELLEIILSYKPDINSHEMTEGWTPLMICSISDHEAQARMLLLSGADKHIKDKFGRTAKQLAEKYNSKKILNLI